MEDREIVRLYLSRNEQAISASRRMPRNAKAIPITVHGVTFRRMSHGPCAAIWGRSQGICPFPGIECAMRQNGTAIWSGCWMSWSSAFQIQVIHNRSWRPERRGNTSVHGWRHSGRKTGCCLFADTGMEIRWRSCQAPLECRKHGSPSGSVACGEGSRHIWSSRGCPYE